MKYKILIVDNEKDICIQIKKILYPEYVVSWAYKLENFYTIFETKKFDLLLLDIMWGEGMEKGIEILEKIRKRNDTKKYIPIIMLTGATDDKYLKKCFELKIDDYIKKKNKDFELKLRIKSILEKYDNINKIKEQKQQIDEGIQVALRLQKATLPSENNLHHIFGNHIDSYFIFNRPLEKLSGDFYWIKHVFEYVYIICADCTGHGVPGALMSMLGVALLNEIIIQNKEPEADKILNDLRKKLKTILDKKSNDGMDIALCMIDTKKDIMQYAGAYNPLYHIRNNISTEYKATPNPIGNYFNEKPFTKHEIAIKKNDIFYIWSDGYKDQFGGKNNKRFCPLSLFF